MTFLLLPLILSLFAVGGFYRDGVPLPQFLDYEHSEYKLQIWDFFISHQAYDFWYLLKENLIIWAVLYIPSQIFLYGPSRNLVADFKFNKKYPPAFLMLKEFLRSVRGVFICTVYEAIVYHYTSLSTNTTSSTTSTSGTNTSTSTMFSFLQPLEGAPVSLLAVLLGGLTMYAWGDVHFYFAHRLLHTKWLYKNVHKFHHESYNPTPFSGLSMHWFESMVYFSAAPLLAMTGMLFYYYIFLNILNYLVFIL
jgi:hypothetical protein